MVESNPAPALLLALPLPRLASPSLLFARPTSPAPATSIFPPLLPLCPALPAAAGWLLPLALPLPDVRSRLAFELDRFRQPPIRNGRTPAQDRQAPRFLVPSQSASLGQARACTITNTQHSQTPSIHHGGHDGQAGGRTERRVTYHTNHSDLSGLVWLPWLHGCFHRGDVACWSICWCCCS